MKKLSLIVICLLLIFPSESSLATIDGPAPITDADSIHSPFKSELFPDNLSAPMGYDLTTVSGSDSKKNELLVRFADKERGGPGNRKEKNQILHSLGGGTVKRDFKFVKGLSTVRLPGKITVKQALKKFKESPDILYAEPDYRVKVLETFPDDPQFSSLWGMHNTGQIWGSKADADIDAPEAWDIVTGNGKVVVAVIDTGVDYNHPDLAANMWINSSEIPDNNLDDDGNGYIDDIYGYDFFNNDGDPMDDYYHGTHCAGTIGAVGNNGEGVTGVCWDVEIMALKFTDPNGLGWTSDAISAIEYSIAMGANLMSNSWGGGGYSQSLKDAIDQAAKAGVLFVAAAGNNDRNNDERPYYPTGYDCENIISVMATDLSDERPFFANYGPNSVDIGAPGFYILSCIPQERYMHLFGSSMAAPHVAGACALMWSLDPELSGWLLKDILLQTTDPTLPGLCLSEGRLNVFNAVNFIFRSEGYLSFDKDSYSCSDVSSVSLIDYDLAGRAAQQVRLTTSSGDSETLILTETSSSTGVFSGEISVTSKTRGRSAKHLQAKPRPPGHAPRVENGWLEVSHGDIITATYIDEDYGNGSQVTVTCTAMADCQGPVISNVELDIPGAEPKVSFQTDEPAVVRIQYGLIRKHKGRHSLEVSSLFLKTNHIMKLTAVSPETDYFCIIEATDALGNRTIDDNTGKGYRFTTTAPGDIYVPDQSPTIQRAIDHSWDGGMVWVADGTYSGDGNRDIDFRGRAITLKSLNGPANTIIDCQGTTEQPHRGFYIHMGENGDSVIDGFTITNGYVNLEISPSLFGAGIYCQSASPTITNCWITKNTAELGGGAGILCADSNAVISNCIISDNRASGASGIYCYYSSLIISNTIISGNIAQEQSGGGVYANYSSPVIDNCTITGNFANWYGGGLRCFYLANAKIINSIMWDNHATAGGDELALSGISTTVVSFSDIEGQQEMVYIDDDDDESVAIWGPGNIGLDPCFVEMGRWIDIADGNSIVEPNDPNAVWVEGDFHLKSQAWRWDRNANQWTWDDVTSRCIDAGSPGSRLDDEPVNLPVNPLNCSGQNLRINMGAYGRTAQAAMPPYNWALMADLTNDGIVSLRDFAYLADSWLITAAEQPGDLNRDDLIGFTDIAILTEDWLEQTSWYNNN